MLLMIDNYDSFTFNLVHYFKSLGAQVEVVRNDELTLQEIEKRQPSQIVISPGPCSPNEAGISLDLVHHFATKLPILGVCLGHQTIAQAYGAKIIRAKKPMHGKTATVTHGNKGIFSGLSQTLEVVRYHSLLVDPQSLPSELEVSAWCEDEIMGLQHKTLPIAGVQFHPESILSEQGHELLENFLAL